MPKLRNTHKTCTYSPERVIVYLISLDWAVLSPAWIRAFTTWSCNRHYLPSFLRRRTDDIESFPSKNLTSKWSLRRCVYTNIGLPPFAKAWFPFTSELCKRIQIDRFLSSRDNSFHSFLARIYRISFHDSQHTTHQLIEWIYKPQGAVIISKTHLPYCPTTA